MGIIHEERLQGVHPDLIRVVRRCAENNTFILIEGLRTVAEEQANVASGASTTMHSRHLPNKDGLACAVDLGALDGQGHLTWLYSYYQGLAVAMKAAAKFENIPIEWGGDWTSFKDGGHFQLPWSQYP